MEERRKSLSELYEEGRVEVKLTIKNPETGEVIKLKTRKCPECNGQGCDYCRGNGFIYYVPKEKVECQQ